MEDGDGGNQPLDWDGGPLPQRPPWIPCRPGDRDYLPVSQTDTEDDGYEGGGSLQCLP